jgi:hypothetical protein
MQGDATQIHINCKLRQSKKKTDHSCLDTTSTSSRHVYLKSSNEAVGQVQQLIKSEKRLLMFISMEFLGIHVPGYFQQGKSETTQACIP